MAYYKNGSFVEDPWRRMAADDNLLAEGYVIVSVARWRKERDGSAGINTPLGLLIQAGEKTEGILDDLHRFALVALDFPKWADGRSLSTARLIRGRYQFCGEVRAVGDVLWDQLQMMLRCGFDAFEISDEPTINALQRKQEPFMSNFYQPSLVGAERRVGLSPFSRQTPH